MPKQIYRVEFLDGEEPVTYLSYYCGEPGDSDYTKVEVGDVTIPELCELLDGELASTSTALFRIIERPCCGKSRSRAGLTN